MRVKDLAAELISEIAEDNDYYVYKFEKTSPGCGFIVYETSIIRKLDDGTEEETIKYKAIGYEGPAVKLQSPNPLLTANAPNTTVAIPPVDPNEIDLHDPESIPKIIAYFQDLKAAFDMPFGIGTSLTTFVGVYSNIHHPYLPLPPPKAPPKAPSVFGQYKCSMTTTISPPLSSSGGFSIAGQGGQPP